MKKLLLFTTLLFCLLCHAQDYKLLEQLKAPVTLNEARSLAVTLANKTVSNKYHYYQEKAFPATGIYIIMFTPQCYIPEEIKAERHVDSCFGIYFTISGDTYTFRKIITNYNDIYPVWTSLFSTKAKKDNNSETVLLSDANMKFSLIEDGPYWVIKG